MGNKLKIINKILCVFVVVISCLIFNNKVIDVDFLYNAYISMINHTNLNEKDKSVSNQLNFIKVSDFTYTNESFTLYCPFSSTVIEIYENSLILKTSKGLLLVFDNLINIKVNKLDYVYENDILANFISEFNFYVIKGGEYISYEEVI